MERIIQLNEYNLDKFPIEEVKGLLSTSETQDCAIWYCVDQGLFKALEYILAFRFDDLVGEHERLRSRLLYMTLHFNRKEIWDFFLLTNRMEKVYHQFGDYFEWRMDSLHSFSGTFAFDDLVWYLWFDTCRSPHYFSPNSMTTLKEYLQDSQEFMNYTPNWIFGGQFKSFMFFDLLSLLDMTSVKPAMYPKLLQLISYLDTSKIDEDCHKRIEQSVCDFFLKIQAGEVDFKEIFEVEFSSPIIRRAFKVAFSADVENAIKTLLFSLIEHRAGSSKSTFLKEAFSIIYMHDKANEPIVFYQFMWRLFNDLMIHACEAATSDTLMFLDSVTNAVFALSQHFSDTESRLTSLPPQCLRNGHLRGEILYILSQFWSRFKVLLTRYISEETFVEVFAIPNICTRTSLFDPDSISSILGQVIDPKVALQAALNQERINLIAVKNIYLMYTVETGDFKLVRFSDDSRSVDIHFNFATRFPVIVVKIMKRSIAQNTEQITQIIGLCR